MSTSPSIEPAFGLLDLDPLADLELSAGDYKLARLNHDETIELANLAATGVYDRSRPSPFRKPWAAGTPLQTAQNVYTHVMVQHGESTPARWRLPLGVWHDEHLVGVQVLYADNFAQAREVGTGSWLAISAQGKGHGTAMREMVLHFAFDRLGALEAVTRAFHDNQASRRVSQKLGYREDGLDTELQDGVPRRLVRFRLLSEDFQPRQFPTVDVTGFSPQALAQLVAE